MALLSTLVERIADVEGIDKVQASGIARYLREAGYISQAGRGRGAAHMTLRDAAHLLIGLNTTKIAKEAPEELKHYCNLSNRLEFISGFHDICKFGSGIVEDFEKIITLCQDENFKADLSKPSINDNTYEIDILVTFRWPERIVMLDIKEIIYEDYVPNESDLAKALYGHKLTDINSDRLNVDRKETIAISHKTFLAVAEVLKTK